MLKQFTKISAVSFGNIFNAILGLTFLTAVARTLSIEDFGKYALLTSLLVSIAKLTDFGSNSTYVAKSMMERGNLKNSFLSLKVLLFVITIPISIIALYILNLFTFRTFSIFLIGLVAYGINFTLFALFQKLEKFGFAVGLNTIPAVIKGALAVLIFTGIFTPNLFLAFSIFSLAMCFSVILVIFLPSDLKHFNFTFVDSKVIFKQSIPAGVSLSINNGWPAVANTIAKIAKTFSAVGIFSLADKIANIFTLISISIFTVLLPKNARRKAKNLKYDLKETALISIGILGLAVAVIIAAKTLLVPVFGDKFTQSESLLSILILASALTAISTFIDNYFFVEDKTDLMMIISITKLAVFLVISAILLPLYDLQGLAIAQLAAATSSLLLTALVIFHFK